MSAQQGLSLDAIRAVATEVESVDIGAGTIIEPAQLEAAMRAGARCSSTVFDH